DAAAGAGSRTKLTHGHAGLEGAGEAAGMGRGSGRGSGLGTEPPATDPGDDAPPYLPRSGWDREPVATHVRLVSLPMIAGGILSIAVAAAALAGVSRLG
ncbi:MAG: hypothetical protein AABZ33_02930, partial [Chloroflexota bacterium]